MIDNYGPNVVDLGYKRMITAAYKKLLRAVIIGRLQDQAVNDNEPQKGST
jgi:hypothetical protein